MPKIEKENAWAYRINVDLINIAKPQLTGPDNTHPHYELVWLISDRPIIEIQKVATVARKLKVWKYERSRLFGHVDVTGWCHFLFCLNPCRIIKVSVATAIHISTLVEYIFHYEPCAATATNNLDPLEWRTINRFCKKINIYSWIDTMVGDKYD